MKTIILGGGPSGLGVAWGLVEKGVKDIVIVEKESQLGGLSGSYKVGESIIDYGPHRFSPEFPELVDRFAKLMGDDWLEEPNHHAVYFQKRFYRYPPVISDFLNLNTFWLSARVLLSVSLQRLKNLFVRPKNETFESIIVRGFGRTFYKLVVEPLCEKIWGDPSKLDPDFAKLRFSVPTVVQWFKKLIGHSDTFNDKVFYYSRKGFQQLWDQLGEELESRGVEIRLNTVATEVNWEEKSIQSVTLEGPKGKETFATQNLVSTIPTQHFLRATEPKMVSPKAMLSTDFDVQGIILVTVHIAKETTLPARVSIFPEREVIFNRLSEQNLFSRDTVPAGQSAVVADIVTAVGSDRWNESDEEISKKIVQQMMEMGLMTQEQVLSTHCLRRTFAYPRPTIEREKQQADLNKLTAPIENLIFTGRFASSDYNNSHTAIKKGLLAADKIAGQIDKAQWNEKSEQIRKMAIRD